jgi:hypothetical protein
LGIWRDCLGGGGNHTRCLILHGVSVLVAEDTRPGEPMLSEYQRGAQQVMSGLLQALPAWLACAGLAGK